VEAHQLQPSVAVGRLQHRDLGADPGDADHAFDPVALDHRGAPARPVAQPLEAQPDEEGGRRRQVLDDDADVLQSPDAHGRARTRPAPGRPSSRHRHRHGRRVRPVSWPARDGVAQSSEV
jgi:hypothetical protein